jgi:hypothetical protein
MKKIFLGALVGGILIFIWQTLSYTIFQLHYNGMQYTDKQEAVLSCLSSQFTEDAQYYMPSLPKGAPMAEHETMMKSMEGKPWAIVSYHKAWSMNMTGNIIRGLIVDILLAGLFCWVLSKISAPRFGTIFMASLFTGFIVFLNSVYTTHIWYHSFDLMAHFTDYLVSWGVAGLFWGWLFSRK